MISSDPGAIVSAGTGGGISSSQNAPASEFDDDAPVTIAPARGDSIGSAPPAAPELAMLLLPGPMASAAMGSGTPGTYSRAAAPAEATLDRSLGDAGVSSNSALRSPENIRALVALSQQSLAVLLAAPQGSGRAAILQLAGLLRAALGTNGPSGEAIGQLRAFLSQHSTDAVLALLASPAPASGPILPAVGLPVVLAAHTARGEQKEAARDDDHDPSGDRRARRATPAEQRLAELALDPRQGLAPEGVAAYEAEREEGMCLQRCPSGEHDFIDETGVPWDIVAPAGSLGLEATLRALLAYANVILSLTKLPPAEWHGTLALVRRLSSIPGARRLIALGQSE